MLQTLFMLIIMLYFQTMKGHPKNYSLDWDVSYEETQFARRG